MAFPQLIRFARMIPDSVLLKLDPRLKTFDTFQRLAKQHMIDANRDRIEKTESAALEGRNSIFRHMLAFNLPESDLSTDRLTKEAQVLLGAGTVSSARTLDILTFYVLNNEAWRQRLQDELAPRMRYYPEKVPTWAELEKLPFMQALLKETLRLSYGVMHRLPRVSPDQVIRYKDWVIPSGIGLTPVLDICGLTRPKVPVGMSAYMMHTDTTVYPDPFTFNPERWLNDVTPAMTRNLVPFSKGGRNCLGMKYVRLSRMEKRFQRCRLQN